jgi:hypothetical protein
VRREIMKKSITKKILVLLVMMVMASGALFAAVTSNVTVTANVVEVLEITVAATVGLGALTPGSTTDAATTNITTKANTGYKVVVTSAQNGFLKLRNAANNDYIAGTDSFLFIPYTLSYDSGEDETMTLAGFELFTASTTSTANVIKVLTFKAYAELEDLSGDYQDDLVFTISAN